MHQFIAFVRQTFLEIAFKHANLAILPIFDKREAKQMDILNSKERMNSIHSNEVNGYEQFRMKILFFLSQKSALANIDIAQGSHQVCGEHLRCKLRLITF